MKNDKAKVVLPEGYKPSETEEYMNELHLEYFRQKLLKWREELVQESIDTINHLREERWNDSDLNDKAIIEADTATELRTRDRYKKLSDKIDQSLASIRDGSYGYCTETGEEIGVKRLEARPIATLCIEAQQKHERYERTHIDNEEILIEDNRSDE